MFERKRVEELRGNILFEPFKDKVGCYIYAKSEYNPYLIMPSLLRVSYSKIFDLVDFNTCGFYKPLEANCSCGRPMVFSHVDYKNMNECPICRGKKLLYKLTRG